MKQTLRFLLSVSNTKMVVLCNEGKHDCYVSYKVTSTGIHHNFTKLADCISEYE